MSLWSNIISSERIIRTTSLTHRITSGHRTEEGIRLHPGPDGGQRNPVALPEPPGKGGTEISVFSQFRRTFVKITPFFLTAVLMLALTGCQKAPAVPAQTLPSSAATEPVESPTQAVAHTLPTETLAPEQTLPSIPTEPAIPELHSIF